jgi:hypothetical protein
MGLVLILERILVRFARRPLLVRRRDSNAEILELPVCIVAIVLLLSATMVPSQDHNA